jgi:transcriptional regulator with XRE-family HTH domain
MPNPMHSPRYAIFRAFLVEKREHSGLTQMDVAARLRKPQSYVSKYERGERRLDLIEFVDIAEALGIDAVESLQHLIKKIR